MISRRRKLRLRISSWFMCSNFPIRPTAYKDRPRWNKVSDKDESIHRTTGVSERLLSMYIYIKSLLTSFFLSAYKTRNPHIDMYVHMLSSITSTGLRVKIDADSSQRKRRAGSARGLRSTKVSLVCMK